VQTTRSCRGKRTTAVEMAVQAEAVMALGSSNEISGGGKERVALALNSWYTSGSGLGCVLEASTHVGYRGAGLITHHAGHAGGSLVNGWSYCPAATSQCWFY
jgi:hypothetical protein